MNHLTHRLGKMDQQDDEIPEVRDDSRPFLLRQPGELGIYFDPIEAEASDPKSYGLRHCFMMVLKEKLQDYLYTVNLVKVKGQLEHRGLFRGCILEEIRKGLILVVTFDDYSSIEFLWNLFEKRKLNALFQELFITKDTLKLCDVQKLVIRAKIWEDEYSACKDEVLTRTSKRIQLNCFKNDLNLLKEIRFCQKKLGDDTLKLRDLETIFESQLDDFIIGVKRILPEDATVIHSLGDFNTYVTNAKNDRKHGLVEIDNFLNALDVIRGIFVDVELEVCCRLSQIHGVCETEEQQDLKQSIKDMRSEMESYLRLDHNLLFVRFNDWDVKINPREKKLFFGLVSLIPMCLEKLVDIDHSIDEFITAFPELAS